MVKLSATIVLCLIISSFAHAAGSNAPKPGPQDKCPVCGMFVSKYPDFVSSILFKDGSSAFFDGPKDLFQCYLDLQRYLPSKKKTDIAALLVSSYYDLASIDARAAYFVVGSDVRGPMGNELIPFGRQSEAQEFLKDHRGKAILRFNEVTPAVLKEMD